MAATPAPAIDPDNPWPGLAAYDEAAREYFFGRAAEAAELTRRIADQPVTVLFGKSGLGKSSLLRAGVFPLLPARGLLPVPVRLSYVSDALPPIEQAMQAMLAAFADQRIEHPLPRAGETLWEYLHRDGLRFWTPKVRPVQPVLVVDQFEEVFTLGRAVRARADALREQLADLAENRIPAALAERLGARDHNAGADEAARPSGLDVHAQPYKIVLSLREDFLPDLEEWVQAMPTLRRNRMRLLPMGRKQALQAVRNERTQHLVDAATAGEIVTYLASNAAGIAAGGADDAAADETDPAEAAGERTVEPALLSLVCRGINEARKRAGKDHFDAALLEAGKGHIVADFYRESLADQPPNVARFIEKELVTDQGFRNSYAVAAALGRGALTRDQIDTLVDRRLLRIEHHLGAERVELTHDLLTRPVLDARIARIAAERTAAQWRSVRRVGAAIAVAIALVAVFTWRELQRAQREEQMSRKSRDAIQQSYGELAQALEKAEDERKRADREREGANEQRARAETATDFAEKQQSVARARELAALARGRLSIDREQAVLIAAEALAEADVAEARAVLINAARYAWPRALLDASQLGGKPRWAAIDPGGTRLAVLTQKGGLSLFDLARRNPTRMWSMPDVDGRVAMTFSHDANHLYIGRPGVLERIDATNPELVTRLPLPTQDGRPEVATQIVASSDGHWLGVATRSRRLLLRPLDAALDDPAGWQIVVKEHVQHFAMERDARRITTVTSEPELGGSMFERDGDGAWRPVSISLAGCAALQSISPAATYLVATWKATTCAVTPERTIPYGQKEAIADSLPSPGGQAFVAVLEGGDLAAGLGNPGELARASRIRAVHAEAPGSMVGLFAVDDGATRLAWIDNEHNSVRVYALGSVRLLLTEHREETLAVAPDGSWLVQALSAGSGFELRITMLEAVQSGTELPAPRLRIPVDGRPLLLRATRDAVILRTERFTFVYDARSGALRAGPFEGKVETLGPDHALLVVPAPRGSGAPDRIVRTRDGAESQAPWPPAADRDQSVRYEFSPASTAMLASHREPPRGMTFVGNAFRIDGERIEHTGHLLNLTPDASPKIADDGRSIELQRKRIVLDPRGDTDIRRALAGSGTTTLSPRLGGQPVLARSPSGRRAVVRDDAQGDEFLVDAQGHPHARLGRPQEGERGYWFSADDHWLGYQDGNRLRVIDLASAEEVLAINDLVASRLRYVAGARLLQVTDIRGNQMLIPLDPQIARRFAKWLVPRGLSAHERCSLGIDHGPQCVTGAYSRPTLAGSGR